MVSIRAFRLPAVLALGLAWLALAGAPAVGPQRAAAADEETTTTEQAPPVVETPSEPEAAPAPETPAAPAPPVATPPVAAPGGDGGGTPVEAPRSTPPTGPGAAAGGGGGGGAAAGGGSSSASGGSSAAAATTSPATAPSRHVTRAPTRTSGGGAGGGGGRGSGTGAGGGGREASGGGRAPAPSGGAPAPQPAVSPHALDDGAAAVGDVAGQVGRAFSEALPAAPLQRIGDRLAAHIAAAGPAAIDAEGKPAADGIGAALGAALIGSAVAVDRAPAASGGPIPFLVPADGGSGTVYLLLIAALLLAVAAVLLREVRSSLGLGAAPAGRRARGARPRLELGQRAAVARLGARRAADRWSWRLRRLRANAVAGLRSLF